MKTLQNTAFLTAIATEIRSLSFYRTMAYKFNDICTKKLFELLANEEAVHLQSICRLFPDNKQDLVPILVDNGMFAYPYYCSMFNSADANICEKDALQIALKDEQACMENYSAILENIEQHDIRTVFEKILKDTQRHCELISEEYSRITNDAVSRGHGTVMFEQKHTDVRAALTSCKSRHTLNRTNAETTKCNSFFNS